MDGWRDGQTDGWKRGPVIQELGGAIATSMTKLYLVQPNSTPTTGRWGQAGSRAPTITGFLTCLPPPFPSSLG